MSMTVVMARVERLVAPVLVFVLIAIVILTLMPPSANASWHSPDAHSSMPHRAPSPILTLDRASAPFSAVLALNIEPGRRVSAEIGHTPGNMNVEPPDQPPR